MIKKTYINKTKVSIIVPTYKRGDMYLQRCLDSLLSQTHNNIEIIVVDDNIPDSEDNINTKKIIKDYSNTEKIIYIKTATNSGAALSRNQGIFKATGDYITFLDDDDIYLPKKIEVQLEYMVEHMLDMSFTDLGLYNEDDKLIDYRSHNYITDFSSSELIKQHVIHNLTGTPTFMYRADKLKEIGGFENSTISNEYYLMEKSINSDLKIGYIPICLVKAYRYSSGGLSFGQKKIDGEKSLFTSKKKYFHLLSNAEKRYTRCRFYAVMAVSYYRNKRYAACGYHCLLSLFSSPLSIVSEIKKRKRLMKLHSKT